MQYFVAPYVFKPSEDPKSAQMEKVMEFVQSEMDDRTKNKDMSKASTDWAESILTSYRVKHDRVKEVVDAVGSFKDPPPYKWTIQTIEGETWNKGEHGGTPGALEWLKENFLRSSSPFNLKVVTGAKLPKVKGNHKSATGKTDILIGKTKDIHKGSTFDDTVTPLALYAADETPSVTRLITSTEIEATMRRVASKVLRLDPVADKDDLRRFSAHSIHVGACVMLHSQGFSAEQLKFLLRWRSDAFMVYLRNIEFLATQQVQAINKADAMPHFF